MNHCAIIPRQQKKTPSIRPGVKGVGTKALHLKLLKDSKASGISVSNTDHLAHAFSGIESDEVPWVAGFPGDVAKAPHSVWFGAPAIPIPRFIKAAHNNYVCVSSFHSAEDGRYRRRKDCWAGLWMVLLDDLGTKIPLDALRLKPSCLVETSPGNFQAWLFLAQPERNQQKAQGLIDGLIAAGATDKGAGHLTRYGRLPTGINGKAKYQGRDGQPFTQRVHVWAPEQRYTPEQIAQAYGFDLAAASKPRPKRTDDAKPAGAGYVPILEAAELYLEPIRGIEGGHRIICPWHRGHTGADTTGTAYFEPAEENGMRGGFKCQHGHCAHRTIADLDFFIARLLAGRAA